MSSTRQNIIRLRRKPRTLVRGGRREFESNDGTASARFRPKLTADELLRSQRRFSYAKLFSHLASEESFLRSSTRSILNEVERKPFGEAESFRGTTGFSPWGSIITLGIISMVAGTSLGYAQSELAPASQEPAGVEVGNTICPVSKEKVGEMGEVVKYEYNGKIYNLCCPICKKDFAKDPEKYSKIAEDEVVAAQAAEVK